MVEQQLHKSNNRLTFCTRVEECSALHCRLFMTALGPVLSRLGLAQYLEVFLEEGFDTWETVLDITESDL